VSRCFEKALHQAGIEIPCDMEIPASPTVREAKGICDALGLRWFPSGPFVLPLNGRYITICGRDDCYHAEYSLGGGVPSRVKYLIGIPHREKYQNV